MVHFLFFSVYISLVVWCYARCDLNSFNYFKSVTLKPEVVDPEDIEMLQDLIISGVNEILKEVDDYGAAEMEKVTGGVSFPGFI